MKRVAVAGTGAGLLFVAAGITLASDPSVWTVESGDLPKKVTVGDTVRSYAHAPQPKGSIQVTVEGAGKLASTSRSIIVKDGKPLLTGTIDMVYDIAASKVGT